MTKEEATFCCIRSPKTKAGELDGRICGSCPHVVDNQCTVQAKIEQEMAGKKRNPTTHGPYGKRSPRITL